ncbi:MAG: hypothetical protein HY904_00800 [Deltaproteobacteria bacterium]|nr:hypothetical protein [Deltaproteobacteria bacterium]
MRPPFALYAVLLLAGCTGGGGSSSSSSSSSSSGAGGSSSGPASSSAASSSGAAAVPEQEPNDGATAADVNAGTVPGTFAGAVDPADDMDIFAFDLTVGTVLAWTLSTPGGVMAPHLALSQDGNRVPTMVARAAAGGAARQEHFVLEGGRYYAIMRDARNVPAAASAHVGSAQHAWQLAVTTLAKTPRTVSFPADESGMLESVTAIETWQFTATAGMAFDIVLHARRKTPPSDMDSRLSLFHADAADWIITNDDDLAESTVDSHVGGTLTAAGSYIVVVENVEPAATDLGYQLVFSLR